MRVLIFGADGIIGKSLVKELSDSFNVIAIDKEFKDIADKTWLTCKTKILDITSFIDVKEVIKKNDVVINLAAISRITECNNDLMHSLGVNVTGAINIMEACRQNNAKQLIQASSLYAKGSFGGFYSASKRAMESYLECFSESTILNITLLRLGSISGGLDDYNSLPTKILRRILKINKDKINVNSRIVRDYLPIDGVCKSIKPIIGNKDYYGYEVEFSLDNPLSLDGLISEIEHVTGKNPRDYLEINHDVGTFKSQYLETPSIRSDLKYLRINIKDKSSSFRDFLERVFNAHR